MAALGLLILFFVAGIFYCNCSPNQPNQFSNAACSVNSDLSYQRGMRYTYRYSTTTISSLQSSAADTIGLALDCLVDIDVLPSCQLMLKLRSSQIKRVSPQKENSVQRIKSLREALERNSLLFSLQDGKVTEVCPWEGEMAWALNIKRAVLSMLQTSHAGEAQETVKETDLYGTCMSSYERRGSVLVKLRDVQQCLKDRLASFWLHSIPLTQNNVVDSWVQCSQHHDDGPMEEANCTETVGLASLFGTAVGARVRSVSTITLLRAQAGVPMGADTHMYCSDLRFQGNTDTESLGRPRDTRESADTVRRLCTTTADQQQQASLLLHLVFQLRALSFHQLQKLWQEASFKCRDDWQPLLDALPACGSEACISLMTEVILSNEVEPERMSSFLSSFAFIPRPSPAMVTSVIALLQSAEVRPRALLAVSCLVHSLCLRAQSPCSTIPQIHKLVDVLKEILVEHCRGTKQSHLTEGLHVLKAVGNAGLAAGALAPDLALCAQNQSNNLELRLAAIEAFRRIPCSEDRQAVLQLYRSTREDAEVRIAAYQQLMRCPDPAVLRKVRATLRNETSSQVGAFVWSHLTQIQKTEDPLKLALMESLPDDIISKDFEGESWKYSSYMDTTINTGIGAANIEGALVFSPQSFVPRSAMANLTVHILGRAFNLLEINLHAENTEPLLKHFFGHQKPPSGGHSGPPDPSGSLANNNTSGQKRKRDCQSSSSGHLRQGRVKFRGKLHSGEDRLRCGLSVRVFGNELAYITCDDVSAQMKQLSLSLAGVVVRLMKGQEVQFNHRAVLATEELVLPSLSGWPIKMAINISSSISLRVKGSANYRDWSDFSIAGYVKPSAYVGVWARMGLDGPCGQAGLEWAAGIRTSTSLDGAVQLQRGQDLKVSLNTPEDVLDIIHFSSKIYSVSGESVEELKVSSDPASKTTCSPHDWSKIFGWQLCSQVSYPSPVGMTLPPAGPVLLSLRLLKLDKGLHQYLLEAAYSVRPQMDSWVPLEASLHLLLGTPQSTVLRDMSLDLTFSSIPQRLTLKITHPLKTIHIQGLVEQVRSMRSAKVELLLDNVQHYYIKGVTDVQVLNKEQRLIFHLEAKVTSQGRPIILSANLTRGLGRKISLSAMLNNVFRETASLSVLLERRLEEEQRQYSVEAEFLLPSLLGSQISGLLQHTGPLWSSVLRLKYGIGGDAQDLRQECHMTQTLRSKTDLNQTYHLRAEQELHCSQTSFFNHKILLRHEDGPGQFQSALDLSFGKHWDDINNKRRVLLSQTFRNQSRHAHTSYLLEFNLQVPEKRLNYRTQLLHSHMRQKEAESSTHLKVNYNDQMPLVAGLHWRDFSKGPLRRWEGSFNMDTPWLYIYTAHKLGQPQRRAVQFSTEITARKLFTVRNLVLEGFYREKRQEREARLHLHTPTDTYLKVSGWGMARRRGLKASSFLSTAWTPALQGDLLLESSKHRKGLHLVGSYNKWNISLSCSFSRLDKKLRKKTVMIKVVLTKPKNPMMELELEGTLKEQRRDRDLYQKQGKLRLRQPFLHLPQSLLLQETFTVDLRRGQYILESRVLLDRGRETAHILTLGYQPSRPFVCSALTLSYSSEIIPQDSELCVTFYNNQTQQEVHGTLRINKKDRLIVLGWIQNSLDLSQQGLTFQVKLIHLLQLQLPPSVNLEGGLHWKTWNGSGFDYLATGTAIINHQEECQFTAQLNGSMKGVGIYTSLRHPYNSIIPNKFQAQARTEVSTLGVKSFVCLRMEGEERARAEADLVHTLEGGARVLGATLALRQTLTPIMGDIRLQLSSNVSADRLSLVCNVKQGEEGLQAQLSGLAEQGDGLLLSVQGGLQHSLSIFKVLPPSLLLEGDLTYSNQLTAGRLTAIVDEVVYELGLSHQEGEKSWERHRPCVPGVEQTICVNLTSSLRRVKSGGLHVMLTQSSTQLQNGLPTNGSLLLSWALDKHYICLEANLQAGIQGLTAVLEGGWSGQDVPFQWELSSRLQHQSRVLLERGVPGCMDIKGHCQVEAGAVIAGLAVHVQEHRKVDVLMEAGRTNDSARLMFSLEHDVSQLTGVVPSQLQMSLPRQLSVSGSVVGSGCGRRLDTRWKSKEGEEAELSLASSCTPHLNLQTSIRHSLPLLHVLGLPARTTLTLSALPGDQPAMVLDLALGTCEILTRVDAERDGGAEEVRSSWTANWTSQCSALQNVGLPESLSISSLLSVSPCESNLSGSVRVGGEALALQLQHSCLPTHRLEGLLTHSFSQLHHSGLPHECSFHVSTPKGPSQNGDLQLKAGSCHISASGSMGPGERSQWVWVTETKCPLLEALSLPAQSQLNGSLILGDYALEALMDSRVDGQWVSFRLSTGWGAGLRMEGELQHSLPDLWGLPGQSQALLAGRRTSSQHYDGEVRLQLDQCSVCISGALQSDGRLEGSLLLHNNCTALQDLGIPSNIEGSGSLAIAKQLLNSSLSLVTDQTNLEALLTMRAAKDQQEILTRLTHSVPLLLRARVPATTVVFVNTVRGADLYQRFLSCTLENQQISDQMVVERTPAEVRVKYFLNHTVDSLRHWGLPENNSIQAELVFGEARSFSVHSQLGAHLASLGAQMNNTPTVTEVTGSLRHSWPWLQKRGLPNAVEVLCSLQGTLPQLLSRANLTVDGEKFLVSSLNVSTANRHLALQLSINTPQQILVGLPRSMETLLTAHYTGSQRWVSVDMYCDGQRLRLAGDLGSWSTGGGEARAALLHSTEGEDNPTLQVEAWARLTDSQLRGSLAVNPKTNSSLAFTVQGHSWSGSKELNMKFLQNIPALRHYLPSRLDTKTQFKHNGSGVKGVTELQVPNGELLLLGHLALTEAGYSQAVELNNSLSQLKLLPECIVVRMTFEGGNMTGRLKQHLVLGGHELRMSAQYISPLNQETSTYRLQAVFSSVPHEYDLDVRLERSTQGHLIHVLLNWASQGKHEQFRALCSWSSEDKLWKGTVDLKQPLTPPVSHLYLHTVSDWLAKGNGNRHQALISWNDGAPVNISLTVNKHWHKISSRGQACLSLSPGQMQSVLPLVDVQGCGSVAQEGNSYSQTAELKWGDKRITQGMKYQRSSGGIHTLQVEGEASNVSPYPCPSHSFLAQVHTNCQDRLEHHLLLGLCPPHPSWAVSGSHQVNAGKDLLFTQIRLSVSGQPQHSSLSLALTNSSTPQRANFSLSSELKIGDGSLELGGSVFSSRRGTRVRIQTRLDHTERLWLEGELEGRCLKGASGYSDGALSPDDLNVLLCLEGRRRVTLNAQRRGGGVRSETLVSVSVTAANQSLTLGARGCAEQLQAAEARMRLVGSKIRNKLLDKIRVLQRLLVEFRHQSQDSVFLQELSEGSLRMTQRAEALLGQGTAEAWGTWRSGFIRRAITDTLPHCLNSLQQISLQVQQELKRPLSTLAGAYHDVTGQRLDVVWREGAAVRSKKTVELLSALLEEHHLGLPLKATLATLHSILDVASQQTIQWAETRLAAALAGFRRQLASLYRLSHSHCEVAVQVPLPRGSWWNIGGAGVTEFLLEEWLLRPMLALAALRPTAELYRLKRKLMDGPFRHQALVVANQFVVSFDGHLYELPGHCTFLLARDVKRNTFTVTLSPNTPTQHTLLVEMSNTSVSISHDGQVEVNCRVSETSFTENGVTVRKDSKLIEVSNQDAVLVSCELAQGVCSLTLDGWQHGEAAGLLGTNDNEAGNELSLPDGSQADDLAHFIHSWQTQRQCHSDLEKAETCSDAPKPTLTPSPPSCFSLFSASDSPLSHCFRVVDPGQFLSVCESSRCNPDSATCRLAAAFVHLCRRNFVPVELPHQCASV